MEIETYSWDIFDKVVHEKVVPSAISKILIEEFMELKQNDTTIVEYTSKFDDLVRYALLLVATLEVRLERFIDGLDHYMSDSLVTYEGEPIKLVLKFAPKWEQKGIEIMVL